MGCHVSRTLSCAVGLDVPRVHGTEEEVNSAGESAPGTYSAPLDWKCLQALRSVRQ